MKTVAVVTGGQVAVARPYTPAGQHHSERHSTCKISRWRHPALRPLTAFYVGTGDARQPDQHKTGTAWQERSCASGNGTSADGNPFGNAVFSYGHRNVQGLAWRNK